MKTVTKETMATRFEHISLKNSDKSPVQAKRNGKTQTWKTRPNEFKIPAKRGLYDYFYIDQNNCNNWIEV
jgi:hypothetical protein